MAQEKPNILFIMADDIGWFNVSAYNHGVMGYRTPNIDRIARDGAMFTDFYGQQAARPGVRRSSPASRRSAPASPKSACRAEKLAEQRRPLGGRIHEALRLCHRPVRQEPSGRPQRTPAGGLCIGYDSGDAVSSLYKPRFDFSSGVLHKVVFDVADDGYADDQKQLQALFARLKRRSHHLRF